MDQEVALKALDAPPVQFDPASSLTNAQSILGNQTKLQMLNRENAGQDIQFRNQLISNAAAHALDANSWDAAMRQAVQKGAPEAQQFIGRYTPLLQQRLFTAYSGASPGGTTAGATAPGAGATAAGGPAATNYDQLYQNATPDQLASSLQKNNAILAALSTVRDQTSYDRAIAGLAQAGIPNATQLAGPYNPLNVIRLYNDAQQRAAYLQDKVAASGTGATGSLVPIPWKETKIKDAFGQERPVVYNPNNPTQAITIKPNAPPPAQSASPFDAFATTMNHAENGTGNPAAKNPLSSATGDGQFIDSTWLNTIKAARPDLVKGMTDKQILALRADPQLSHEMTAAYARQNAETLSENGLPVTTATLALAHRFGPAGAETILKAAPNARLSDILPKKVIDANPQLATLTAGQYAQSMVRQFGNAQVSAVKTPRFDDFDLASIDPNLTGWDYAKQYPVEVQDAARAYMQGGVMPTGNQRNNNITSMAKTVAQKVAADLGKPELADDTLYPQRRQMQVELAKTTSPQAIGGQITFGGTALGHLAQYATDLAELNNYTAGITPLGHGINWMRSLGPQQAAAVNKANSDAQHYGQEITKFYGGGPGGTEERNRFLASSDPATKTPQELAGIIRGERDLIPERYAQIRGNIENVLGPEAAAKALARMDIKNSIDKINGALAKLDPTGPEAKALKNAAPAPAVNAAAVPPALPAGWSVQVH